MLLQLAIDDPAHLWVVPQVIDFVDIVEAGTPLLKRFGLAAIATLRELGRGRPVLADTKTVDGGAGEAEMVFGAGAEFMTVLSCAPPATCSAVDRAADKYDAHVIADTIAGPVPRAPSQFPRRFAYVALHSPADERLAGIQSSDHIDRASSVRELGYRVAVAGGINPANLAAVIAACPEIVVAGRAVTCAQDPRSTAEWISSQLPDRGRGWPPSPRYPA